MEKELLHRVFGSVSNLERFHKISKDVSSKNRSLPKRIVNDLNEQDRVLKHMRRVANTLMLEAGRGNLENVARQTSIFYSLHQMVRFEVMSTYRELYSAPARQATSEDTTYTPEQRFH